MTAPYPVSRHSNHSTQWVPSLWVDTATEAPDCPPLTGQSDTDVVVIGAGYTGLSAALHLQEAGLATTVLDSAGPGWGCSGRNGGQVNPAWKQLPESLDKMLGPTAARRAIGLANDACDLVFELVERFSIECEVRRPGYVQGAYGNHGVDFLREWVRQWSDRGVDTSLLDRDTAASLLGTSAYNAAMYDGRGGSVQPLSYARGLARAARTAGARIHGHSRVVNASHDQGGWLITTADATIRARHVLWCTNGYTDHASPGLRNSIVPVSSMIVASEPLDDAQRKVVLPGGHAVSETARIQVYYRLDNRGRLVFGGRGDAFNTRLDGSTKALEAQAIRLFPILDGITWQYRWGGHPAMTTDRMPRLMQTGKNAYAALGYNGRGVAMGTIMGRELSHAVIGGETRMEITPLRQIPFHRLRQLGITWTILTGRLLDRIDGA